MRPSRFALLAGLWLIAWPSFTSRALSADAEPAKPAVATSAASAPSNPANGTSYVLLVGCTKYYNHPAFELEGPGNDVDLLRATLIERYQVPKENFVELSEKSAAKHGANYRPTHDNIQSEFAELARKAKDGDQVVVLMSMHGSRQPEHNPPFPDYPKPDAQDQIYLPADTGSWDDARNTVAGAIPDYELRGWLKAITNRHARLWLIIDSCCSGATLRLTERSRFVSSDDKGLAIPLAAFERARQRSIHPAETPDAKPTPTPADRQSPDFVAIYASEPAEPTFEDYLPPGTKTHTKHGLLTFALCTILEGAAKKGITYTELTERIRTYYCQIGRTSGPTPLVEGLAKKREVMHTTVPSRSNFTLCKESNGNWTVNAGEIHGLTKSSILAVYPPRDAKGKDLDIDKRLGYVQVSESGMLTSTVIPFAYNNLPEPAASGLAGARCEPERLDYGPMRLKVAIDNRVSDVPAAQTIVQRLEAVEQKLIPLTKEANPLLQLVNLSDAQWIVQYRKDLDGRIVLLSADAANQANLADSGATWFEIADTMKIAELKDCLRRIVVVKNLLKLTQPQQGIVYTERPRSSDELSADATAIAVDVQMLRLKNGRATDGEPVSFKDGPPSFAVGEWVGWRVVNRSVFPVDVTLLYVDAKYHIQAAFPARAGGAVENRFPPKGIQLAAKAQVSDDSTGMENLAVIAMRGTGSHHDFSFMAEPTLEQASARGGAISSPLGDLCKYALFGEGESRGAATADMQDYSMKLLVWRTRTAKNKTSAH